MRNSFTSTDADIASNASLSLQEPVVATNIVLRKVTAV